MLNRKIEKNVGVLDYFQSTADYTALLQLRDVDNNLIKYWVFDKLKKDIEGALSTGKYTKGTLLEISHIVTKSKAKGEKFNKIVDVANAVQTPQVITGTITNTNNVRALNKKSDNVYFCLKLPGQKVRYMYMNKQLAESAWFTKGQDVMVEAYRRPCQGEHVVYEVKSLFRY